jgi:hypothetical protein
MSPVPVDLQGNATENSDDKPARKERFVASKIGLSIE